MINTDNISRFFAFGCSFTNYNWYTWADILAYELQIPYWNRATSGASNPYIAAQVAQMDLSEKFGPGDLVMIMWTNPARQDVFQFDDWKNIGNIYAARLLELEENDFMRPFTKFPPEHFLIRDLVTIKHVHDSVQSTGANCVFMSMCDLEIFSDQLSHNHRPSSAGITDIFSPTLEEIQFDFYTEIWNNNLDKIRAEAYPGLGDYHPSILEHQSFVNRIMPLSKKTLEWSAARHIQILDVCSNKNPLPPKRAVKYMQTSTSLSIW